MNALTALIRVATPLLVALTITAAAASTPVPPAADPLFSTIAALDSAVFDAFNQCEQPAQLQRHAGYFDEHVEFYHDKGGVTWTRQDMLANTERYVCGKIRRELVPGSLKVFPIKDYGAIAQGVHLFCQTGSGECEGMADFVIVWHQQGTQWQITRVLSYGHRPNNPATP